MVFLLRLGLETSMRFLLHMRFLEGGGELKGFLYYVELFHLT